MPVECGFASQSGSISSKNSRRRCTSEILAQREMAVIGSRDFGSLGAHAEWVDWGMQRCVVARGGQHFYSP